MRLLAKEKHASAREAEQSLLTTHQVSPGIARYLAQRAFNADDHFAETPEAYLKAAPGYVDAQYAGKKVHLRPIFDAVIDLARTLGDDVRVCPCTTIVPLFRTHVFAQLKPSTSTRVDLGLALAHVPESKIPKRLIDTGGKAKKDRITHRIPLERVEDIDAVVEKWLRVGYEGTGGPRA